VRRWLVFEKAFAFGHVLAGCEGEEESDFSPCEGVKGFVLGDCSSGDIQLGAHPLYSVRVAAWEVHAQTAVLICDG